jgi:hypothetical protein
MIPQNLDRPPMQVEVRCRCEHDFNRTTTKIIAGPYTLALLPKVSGGATEGVLSFEDARINTHGFSNPDEEARIILDVLSLLSATTWNVTGLRVNGIDTLGTRRRLINLETERLPGDIDVTKNVMDVLRLDAEALKQFVRASHAFSLGIQAGSIDLALSFMLLVTAVECLSSLEGFIPNAEMNKDSKSTERFVQFVKQFCSELPTFYGHDGEDGFTRNLKTIYHVHRSGFVHAGKEVSAAAVSTADEQKLSSVTHYVDGKQIDTPGLLWFARVVQKSLVGFLGEWPKKSDDARGDLQEIAARRGIITLPVAGVNNMGS